MNLFDRLLHAPIHPMVVHFPIALTGAALFFIFLALVWKDAKNLEQIAFANISLAAVSTVVAAFFGIYDNATIYKGNAPYHQYKIVLAILLFLVTTTTSLLRWKKPDLFVNNATKWWYAGAYLVSFGIAAVLGFLGGIIAGY
jgi:uncharacterized membrane protein